MSEQFSTNPITCAVCGRSLLPGERALTYVTRDGAEAEVCELCRARAEAAGWMLPADAAAARRSGAGRERRRPRGERFNELLSKVREGASTAAAGARPQQQDRARRQEPASERESARAEAAAPEPPGSRRGARREQSRQRQRPQAERAETRDRPVANTGLEGALRAFNGSEHSRTVAGLGRTLGPPRASGIAVRTDSGASGFRLTVAWEITWYQWEVEPKGTDLTVREIGRGDTIEELRAADRKWNLGVSSDGTLGVKAPARRAPASAPNA